MPYNSYFPVSYQPMVAPQTYYPPYNYNQPQQVPTPAQSSTAGGQNMTSGIIWVQGEAGAKSYLVAPNTTVQLWDSERQTIYIKSADASGMPSIKTLDYTIREMPQNSAVLAPTGDSTAFATKDEVQMLSDKLEALRGDFDGLAKRRRREVTDSE